MRNKIIEKELSYTLGGIFFEIQNELGRFCRERQYADTFEQKLKQRGIAFQCEYPIPLGGRESNLVDFFINGKINGDFKAKPFITKNDYYQMQRYLKTAGIALGLIVNFRDRYLKPRRVLNSDAKPFVDSDTFVVLDRSKGFTLIEVLITTAIIAFLVAGIALFTRDIFLMNDAFREAILTEQQAGPVIKEMIAEIRTASQSSVGSYPIETAATSTFTFYANIDSDAYKERVRYFREDSSLKKGILKPTGYPLSYLPVNEKVRPMVRYLAATTTPIFLYYGQNYAGTTSPLLDPVDILKIRLVKIKVIVDKDPAKLPEPQIFESQTAIRNLKDSQ